MSSKIMFVEDTNLSVELVDHMGSDRSVANAAWVSTDGEERDVTPERIKGLIRYLAKSDPKHTSPFEHVTFTFKITAPLFVRDQWVRHRTQSYNCRSLRYAFLEDGELNDLFYIPPYNRPIINTGTGARPKMDFPDDASLILKVQDELFVAYYDSLESYRRLLDMGVASEVARMVLPEATMTSFFATANLLNWWRFYVNRTADNAQWEIKELAIIIGKMISEYVPLSWEFLND